MIGRGSIGCLVVPVTLSTRFSCAWGEAASRLVFWFQVFGLEKQTFTFQDDSMHLVWLWRVKGHQSDPFRQYCMHLEVPVLGIIMPHGCLHQAKPAFSLAKRQAYSQDRAKDVLDAGQLTGGSSSWAAHTESEVTKSSCELTLVRVALCKVYWRVLRACLDWIRRATKH